MTRRTERRFLRGVLDPEDLVVSVWTLLMFASPYGARAVQSFYALAPGFRGLILLVAVYGGLFLVLGTRPAGADRGEGRERRPQAVPVIAALTQLLGVPFFAYVTRMRDEGEQIFWGLVAALALLAFMLGQSARALDLRVSVRRAALVPITVLNTWFCCELLVGRYIFQGLELQRLRQAVTAGAAGTTALELAGVTFRTAALMAVPYLLLVIPPRVLAGERAGARAWALRFVSFVLSVVIAFVVEAER